MNRLTANSESVCLQTSENRQSKIDNGTPTLLGVLAGVLAGALLAALLRGPGPEPTGPMLEEYSGPIRSVVMQYTHGAAFVWPVYRQFLQPQPATLHVYLACPAQADFDECRTAIGATACTITPLLTGHTMTAWARDRWVELLPAKPGTPATLLAPQGELQQEIWPERAGDGHLAEDIAHALPALGRAQRSALYFDGGDYLADGPFVFVAPAVLQRNLQKTVGTREKLYAAIERDLHRQPILLDDAPPHHAGMYMMAAGQKRMVVGDPGLGRQFFAPHAPTAAGLEGGPDFDPATQHRFDSVAATATANGYQVSRIATVPARHGKMYLTYVNVIMDRRAGQNVVYMPVYDDQPQLNAAAQKVWESLGYQVYPINCTNVWQRGGTLHCLVNVLERATAR